MSPRFSSRRNLKNIFRVKKDAKNFDKVLLGCVVLLTLFGLLVVYDVSVVQAYSDFNDKYYYIRQQIIWAVLGFILLGILSIFNFNNFKKLAPILFFISFVLLLAVLIPGLGVSAGGAHRWLRIGSVTIQPGEIIKISSIIFLATLFEKRVKSVPFLIIAGSVVAILALFQKDMGSSIVYFLTLVCIYIIAGSKLTHLLYFLPVVLFGFLFFILNSSYRKNRVLAFLDPFSDPQGFSYHISQVLIALGSGGLFGLGIGQSRQKFEYIPEVTTDSIFAVIGEEFGFFGSVFLILVISLLIYRGFKIAHAAKDRFGMLLATGLTCWLAVQTLLNLAAMVSLIPLTGVPLPFISYGGSALLANLMAVGILLNISRQTSSK